MQKISFKSFYAHLAIGENSKYSLFTISIQVHIIGGYNATNLWHFEEGPGAHTGDHWMKLGKNIEIVSPSSEDIAHQKNGKLLLSSKY